MSASVPMAEDEAVAPSLCKLKEGLLLSYVECAHRGLLYSAHWAIELADSIEGADEVALPEPSHSVLYNAGECVRYSLGKSQFALREFRRAAHTLRGCCSDEGFFLRCYCLYLAGEKDKEDNSLDVIGPEDGSTIVNSELANLKRELVGRQSAGQMDGFAYYLYGVVLKELGAMDDARKMFLSSIKATPLLWASWKELARLCDDREMLYGLELPDHWLKDFFLAEASLEILPLATDALAYYTNLAHFGFARSSYVTSQLALANYHLKDVAESFLLFSSLRHSDPYRLADLDVYSNVLFVMEKGESLSRLAQDCVKIDKYCSETCCVIGNFYGLRGDHENAIVYFQRAAKLNRADRSVWILLGHEYLELKNCSLAIEAYSRALEVWKHDFRGHYGLAQVYELLRMPKFALYYYKQAHRLKSSDPRILLALGSCYYELNQLEEAKKCMKQAVAFKDQEGVALIKLAELLAKTNEDEDAAKLYNKFIAKAETSKEGVFQPEEQSRAHLFLAKHHLKRSSYDEAEAHAHKCMEYIDTREEGKSILQEVLRLREEEWGGSHDRQTLEGLCSDQEFSPIT